MHNRISIKIEPFRYGPKHDLALLIEQKVLDLTRRRSLYHDLQLFRLTDYVRVMNQLKLLDVFEMRAAGTLKTILGRISRFLRQRLLICYLATLFRRF